MERTWIVRHMAPLREQRVEIPYRERAGEAWDVPKMAEFLESYQGVQEARAMQYH